MAIAATTYGSRWQPLQANNRMSTLRLQVGQVFGEVLRAPFGAITAHAKVVTLPAENSKPHALAVRLLWGAQTPRSRRTAERWSQLPTHQRDGSVVWADFRGRGARSVAEPYTQPAPHERTTAEPWGSATPQQATTSSLWLSLVARGALVALPWGPMGTRSAWVSSSWPVEPGLPPPGPGTDPITVPIQAVYIMIPTLEAVLVPSGESLPILSATISGDLSAWAWTLTAAMSASGLALVNPADNPTPVEIRITVNGYAWIFFVEAVDDNRRFGSKTLTVRGRSRSAGLAGPYAQTRTYTSDADLDASQLATNELTPYGWTLLWQTVDWLVPAGTFTYQDLAPIDALSRVAASVGAAVITDPSDLSITVQPHYPVSPWSWDNTSPYAIIPASILTQGDGSWQGGINANGVYVYSENAGFGALVLIDGTDGAKQIPMVVDRMTISADPVRERGRIELGRAGRIKTETRVIPLFPAPAAPGLIPLGQLLEIADSATESWVGQVMSVRINADRAGSAISVRQTLGLERQFRPAP